MPDNKTLWQVSLSKGYFWDSLADCLETVSSFV